MTVSSTVASPSVTIGLLGPVAVDSGRGMVEIPGTRARRLLAALTLQPGNVRSSAVLIDLVWSDAQPKSPQSALHTQISRLRQALPDGMIQAGAAGYRLDLRGHALDIERARTLIDDGTSGSLELAEQMWRGVPGDDLGDDELAGQVRAVGDDLRRRLDERRCRVALEVGDHETARRVAQALCDHDPLDEPAHVLLMRALQAAGRTTDALAVHARLRRALSTELGVDPGSAVETVHRQIIGSPNPPAVVPSATTEPAVPMPRGARASTGLRAEPNELIGRDADIDAVLAALDRHRVVTIAGPGGAGKTRLAQAVGHRVAESVSSTLATEPRSVLVVELASVRTDDDVVGAVAGALGVGEIDLTPGARPLIPIGDLSARLVDALTGRGALLILDNCEQIVDGCARVVSELISAVPDLVVLTTSRAPLVIAGEAIHRLGPLAVDDDADSPAIDLFVARATAVRPDVALDRGTVAQLCRDLDGLPLAIELAAARVRTMSVAQIARLLAERLAAGRLSMLRSGDRTAPERHRTLQAVIDWSWDLLDVDARSALRRLCRFPAGFSGDAARVVLGPAVHDDPIAVDDALESLVNQSLLTVSEAAGRIRYRMLEMVREFGEERLVASGEGHDVDTAMARWATERAVGIRSRYDAGDHGEAMVDVSGDADNMVWVLRRCTDPDPQKRPGDHLTTVITVFPVLAGSWIARGLHAEVRNWAPRIVTLLAHPPTGLDHHERELWQASLQMAAGHLLMISTEPRPLARAMVALRTLQDPASVMTRRTDFVGAIMLARTTYSWMRIVCRGCRSDVPEVRAIALSVRSNARENVGDLAGALKDSTLAYEMARDRGDLWISGMGLMELGSIHGQCGRYAEAVHHYREAATALAHLGADDEVTQVRSYLLASLIGAGHIDDARAVFTDIARGWTPEQPIPHGSLEAVAGVVVGAAEIALATGDLTSAADIAARGVRHMLGDTPVTVDNPSVLLTVSAQIALLSLAGRADVAVTYVPAMSAMLNTQFMPAGLRDLPQTGAGAMAIGAAMCLVDPGSDDGARLMALGARLRGRMDYPSLGRIRLERAALSGMSSAAWQSVCADTDRMPRRRAAESILSILQRCVTTGE